MGEFVRNCRLCKEPMESSPFMMCPTCLIEGDRVRSFIRKHPLVSVEEISTSTNVDVEKVKNMVKLGLSSKHENKILK
ncbi:hypothetical protein [Virgibacillus halodenitrificans]|jgi:hypothetical protein|uniref:Uncharacterized protein n=1 Tax=Virgibacillus halodenitrificans TaxID=1482 RepID=A0AAC9NK69_VIRHA|nr:hypothetical protein [Virgibacillus halodenitrificans]APC47394.1 hypothetical protein BME96_04075 [Virgibacillus halodenitrificans]MBD1221674.1 hypothetical protein [Virgibacillus halodenitrificans]MCG1029752.1 hypothetical protein [Virgibacillus halodenitrificans]MCJ0932208.1 hypothetical protein [Virgibacillus halodenitrificans]MEC2160660.1 hypothetical protein [Virgibacillus halodenitrificans]